MSYRESPKHPTCRWCLKQRKPSDWEQQGIHSDEYHRLCIPCAERRLNNPWNALLPMRKVETRADETGGAR